MMSNIALLLTKTIGAAGAILALASPALAQSWEDKEQGEYPTQSADDENANVDDTDATSADDGNYEGADSGQIEREQDDEQQNGAGDEAAEGDRSQQDYRGWQGGYALAGSGVGDLHPALRDTPQGRIFVLRRFDINRDGRIDRAEARDANRAFFQLADRNRDGQLNGGEIRYALSEKPWRRGEVREEQSQRWDPQPGYDDR
jgi:hypothetical protein